MWNGAKKGVSGSKRSVAGNMKQSASVTMTMVAISPGGQQSAIMEPNCDRLALVTIKHTRLRISENWPKGIIVRCHGQIPIIYKKKPFLLWGIAYLIK